MIKDDTKEQISLFDLPEPAKAAEKKASPPAKGEGKPAVAKAQVEVKAAPERKPAARAVKRKEAPRPQWEAKPAKAPPGPVPEGDVRLTANIREELHLKLKIAAATRRTTIGELIEELVETYL